jgi:uncharacterized protein (DUF2141 family)
MIHLFYLVDNQQTAHKNDNAHSITVKAENLRNTNGIVQFALYNTDASLPDENYEHYYKIRSAKIIGTTAICTFVDLPAGKYAVNIFHDENLNGKIDKGLILPVEGIGFSNFKTINLTNRPNFSKASFWLTGDTKIDVKMLYL